MNSVDENRVKLLEDKISRLERLLEEKDGKKKLEKSAVDELQLKEIPMAKTRVLMHELILASQADDYGICFGGQVLSWIDICAGLAAKNAARGACVTASLDTVHFFRPCRSGCIAIVCAMARSDPVNKKLPVVVPDSKEEQQTYLEAGNRRQERLEKRALLRSNEKFAAREAVARLQPIHEEGGPTLPPAIRADSLSKNRLLEVAPSVTTAHMTQLIMPQHANSFGITFGGQLLEWLKNHSLFKVLSWMETCVAISASRLRGGHMLTASIDTMTFAKPTKVGDILYISSQVTAIFHTSMEVMVTVYGEDIREKQSFHCADAFVTVTCVDDDANPLPIHIKLAPQTEAERIRHEGAPSRRESRLESRTAVLSRLCRKRSLDGHRWGEGYKEKMVVP